MNIIKSFNKILNKESTVCSKSNLFRNLTYKEKQAVELFDFRDIYASDPNNNVIITCEHASNETHKYRFPKDQEKWLDSHWGYDIGSKDMGIELSEKAKILSVYANFSRFIIYPIKEALNFTKPRYAISVHSFTKQYEDNPERTFEVGILFRERNLLVDMIESVYKREGVSYRLNEPYKPEDGVCSAMDALHTHSWPEWYTNVVLLEFRNDYCNDPIWRRKQVKMLSPIIEELKHKH